MVNDWIAVHGDAQPLGLLSGLMLLAFLSEFTVGFGLLKRPGRPKMNRVNPSGGDRHEMKG